MLHQIDLRELAAMSGPERAFVTLYASGPDTLGSLRDREERIRRLLADEPAELEHFEESLRMIRETLEEEKIEGGIALFSCWALEFLVGYPLSVPTPDLLWVGASPYIRPLAELQDYLSRLKAITGGEGSYTMDLSHYDPVPARRQQELVAAFKPREEAD